MASEVLKGAGREVAGRANTHHAPHWTLMEKLNNKVKHPGSTSRSTSPRRECRRDEGEAARTWWLLTLSRRRPPLGLGASSSSSWL